jgi:uncharacterized RDD family membrane protein YckC
MIQEIVSVFKNSSQMRERKMETDDLQSNSENDANLIPEENKLGLWPRFFARFVDNFLAALFIGLFIGVVFNESPKILFYFSNPVSNSVICLFIWVFIESIFISTFGRTLGKWLFNVKVISPQESLTYGKALLRSFMVYARGMALGFPVILIFTIYFASRRVRATGSTVWDEKCGLIVDCQPMSKLRIIINTLIVVGLMFIGTELSKMTG